MTDRYVFAAGVAGIWTPVAAIAYVMARELGWGRLRRYPAALLIVATALASFPAAGFVKLALPHKRRIVAMFRRTTAAPLVLDEGCSVFPRNNIWNTPVRDLPVDPHSAAYVRSIGAGLPLHGDFGPSAGIPYS